MNTEFIYWRHIIPQGIKIEEITGREDKSGKVWRTLAYQVYGENGKTDFRTISHTPLGAPLIDNENARISVSHADRMLVVASLPKTPEIDLTDFNTRTAVGVDTERQDREQVLKIRSKFLSDSELTAIPQDDVTANLIAWTAKEALYKAALLSTIDYRNDLRIVTLPTLQTQFPLSSDSSVEGKTLIRRPEGEYPFDLISYLSDGYIITVAFSPKCAKFKKSSR